MEIISDDERPPPLGEEGETAALPFPPPILLVLLPRPAKREPPMEKKIN